MLLFVLFACQEPESGVATITLDSPTDGEVVCGTPLPVLTTVTGIELVDPYPPEGTEAEPGTGHIDVSLNGQDVFMTGTADFEIPDVAEGAWQLKVELSNADHTALLPYAGQFIYVEVSAEACP